MHPFIYYSCYLDGGSSRDEADSEGEESYASEIDEP